MGASGGGRPSLKAVMPDEGDGECASSVLGALTKRPLVPSVLSALSYGLFKATGAVYSPYSHLTDEETEAQSTSVTCAGYTEPLWHQASNPGKTVLLP